VKRRDVDVYREFFLETQKMRLVEENGDELLIALTAEEVQVIERATRHDQRIQKSPGGAEADVRDGLYDLMNDLRLYEL
jgi:hypothetical protein